MGQDILVVGDELDLAPNAGWIVGTGSTRPPCRPSPDDLIFVAYCDLSNRDL
jgi:hypothetical protein